MIYRLATKCTTENVKKRHKCHMDSGYTRHTSRKDTARLSTMTHGTVTAGRGVAIAMNSVKIRALID